MECTHYLGNRVVFDSVLVANRGEIAVRVITGARAQGYRTIAVYSEADADAPHVALADEAVCIGPAPVRESYLDMAAILDAAARTQAGAIHPGYGFLSENADFAQACERAGIVFIGPSAKAIELMGNKAAAKRLMIEARVPCIPGYQGDDQSDATLIDEAQKIGTPLMVKAAAGGGGRGMRLIWELAKLPEALATARSESLNAFGSDELILERAVQQPRHVEIQVFGDAHGNLVHLGERDCSIQRRHQKVVEEAPCPVMTPELRNAMGQAAVDAAKAIDYRGAGTVEFLLEASGAFYFLEMNTRLQVEHPVTELVTGQDLVAWQLAVAQGEPLPLGQDDIQLRGHAMEVRIYAEDGRFLPATGKALRWQVPLGVGIRLDTGLVEGQGISPFYDAMVAKLIAYGDNREQARRRLVRALQGMSWFGCDNNRALLAEILAHREFVQGEATTAFIDAHYTDAETGEIGYQPPQPGALHQQLATLLAYRSAHTSREPALVNALDWPTGEATGSRFEFGDDLPCQITGLGQNRYRVTQGEERLDVSVLADDGRSLRLQLGQGGKGALQGDLPYLVRGAEVWLQWRGEDHHLVDRLAGGLGDKHDGDAGVMTAPMHGVVVALHVKPGDTVAEGQCLAVMEAMKMEQPLLARGDGEVAEVLVREGEQLDLGARVLTLKPTGSQ